MNNVEVSGTIYKPEFRQTASGQPVFSAALRFYCKKKEDESWDSQFINIVAFKELAAAMHECLPTKTKCVIKGYLKQESWDSKEVKPDGTPKKNSRILIVAQEINLQEPQKNEYNQAQDHDW